MMWEISSLTATIMQVFAQTNVEGCMGVGPREKRVRNREKGGGGEEEFLRWREPGENK